MKGKAMQFEDLRVWKITRELAKSIYGVTRASVMSRDYALKDQMRRSAISSMSNIAEGYERDGNRELRQFLSIAKGSIGELRSQLYIALDAGYLVKSEADSLLERIRTRSTQRLCAPRSDRNLTPTRKATSTAIPTRTCPIVSNGDWPSVLVATLIAAAHVLPLAPRTTALDGLSVL